MRVSRWGFLSIAVIGLPVLLISFQNFAPAIPLPDPTVKLQTCSTVESQTCAEITYVSGGTVEIPFSDLHGYQLIASGLIGIFDRPAGSLGYLYIYASQGEEETPELTIFDLDRNAAVATASPIGNTVKNTYFSFITDPKGNKYPFLAPGEDWAAGWAPTLLCVFDPESLAKENNFCSKGFKDFQISSELSGLQRLNGGTVVDEDGDGWTDIHLPFLNGTLVISGRTGQQLAFTSQGPDR